MTDELELENFQTEEEKMAQEEAEFNKLLEAEEAAKKEAQKADIEQAKENGLSKEAEEYLAKMNIAYSSLTRDKAQDAISLKEYIQAKVETLKRIDARKLNTAKSETPKDASEYEKKVRIELSQSYKEDIRLLGQILETL